jgi:aminocarboxymuconate-semialdehyde decarboxylase
MSIDIHAHYFPSEYVDRLASLGSRSVLTVRRAFGGGMDLEERLSLMDEAGIELQVLTVGPQVPYFEHLEDAAGAARLANDLFARACRQRPDRYAAFASLPLPHVEAAIAEARRALDMPGMLGVTVGTSVRGQALDEPLFAPLWEELDRRAAVLFLHPVGAGGGPLTADYGLTWTIGSPIEDTTAALRLVLSGWSRRYRNIKVIVPHLGGTLPFLFQRLDDETRRQRAFVPEWGDMPERPSQELRRFWFDTVNRYPSALRCTCDAFGAERVLLGTDFPYLAGAEFVDSARYIERTLAQDEAAAVLEGNARQLLGLGG